MVILQSLREYYYQLNDPWYQERHIVEYYAVIFLIIGILIVIKLLIKPIVISNWHHLFDNMQFSSSDVYSRIEEELKKKQLYDIKIKKINLPERGWFSANRIYLKVRREELYYCICAAPYGTGYFVSWWQLYKPGLFEYLISKLPLTKNIELKATFYQADTETMFKENVHHVVIEVVKGMSTEKGYRALTELEQRPTELKPFIR